MIIMKKNDNINLTIQNYGCNAEGVAVFDGQVVFVPYSLVDENIDATIIKQTSKTNLAKIDQIKNVSQERIVAPCPYFAKCGGCQLQHTNYQNTLKIKTEIVQNAISKIGKINCKVNDCIASDNQYAYRNKIAMPINPKTKSLGMYRPDSHNIIDIDACMLQKQKINKLIKIFNQYLNQTKNTIFDEQTKKGLLKSLVAREIGDTLLVTVVINGDTLPDAKFLYDLLKQNFDNLGLSININKLKNNVILSNNFKNLFGIDNAILNEYEIKYQINNQSFLQVNDNIKHKIYDRIFEQIKDDIVIDAYSGAGLLSAMIAKHAKKVFGIEIVEEATKLADNLAKQNNLNNLTNINGDCAVELPKLLSTLSNTEKQNLTIVLDPPRKGCNKNVVDAILNAEPNKIIYLSCDPSTLARDLYLINQSNKYNINFIQPYDMFPQTKHVETLVVLNKK